MKNNLILLATFCLCTFTSVAEKPDTPSTIIQEFYVAVDAGDFDKAAAMLSDDVKVFIPFSPQAMDKMSYKQLGIGMKAGFPDMQHKILDVSEGKGTLAYKAWFSGTNTGSLQGNPPTGNRVETPFLGYLKLDQKGRITEMNIQFDVASFNAQLMKGLNPVEMNRQAVVNIMENLNKRDLDGVVAKCSTTAKFNGWGPQPLDAKGYKATMSELLAAFPDSRFIVDDVVAEGDKVVVRHRFEGTHTGAAFQGVSASRKNVAATATVTFQMQHGKPETLWLNADFLSILTQIGAIPVAQN